MYDDQDWASGNASSAHLASYHITGDTDTAEARVALMERTVELQSVYAETSSSLRLTWRLIQPHKYIEGYFINFREKGRPRAVFTGIKVHHARATSYTIKRLEAATSYQVFVVPFYKSVMGMPSASVGVRTLEDVPSQPPVITNVTLMADNILVHWLPLDQKDANGLLEGYRVLVTSSADLETLMADIMVTPSEVSAAINIPDLSALPGLRVEVAAVNKAGLGPFSAPVTLDTGGGFLTSEGSLVNMNTNLSVSSDSSGVWVGALVGSLGLFLVCILVVVLMRQRRVKEDKDQTYLANTGVRGVREEGGGGEKDETLWIDRRWNAADSSQDGSCHSDKKLLQHMMESSGNVSCHINNLLTFLWQMTNARPKIHWTCCIKHFYFCQVTKALLRMSTPTLTAPSSPPSPTPSTAWQGPWCRSFTTSPPTPLLTSCARPRPGSPASPLSTR